MERHSNGDSAQLKISSKFPDVLSPLGAMFYDLVTTVFTAFCARFRQMAD